GSKEGMYNSIEVLNKQVRGGINDGISAACQTSGVDLVFVSNRHVANAALEGEETLAPVAIKHSDIVRHCTQEFHRAFFALITGDEAAPRRPVYAKNVPLSATAGRRVWRDDLDAFIRQIDPIGNIGGIIGTDCQYHQ